MFISTIVKISLCYICERQKRKGEQCESCDTFFCDECIDAYCDGIHFECDCYACNGGDDSFCFMGVVYTLILAQQPPLKIKILQINKNDR